MNHTLLLHDIEWGPRWALLSSSETISELRQLTLKRIYNMTPAELTSHDTRSLHAEAQQISLLGHHRSGVINHNGGLTVGPVSGGWELHSDIRKG